MEKRVYEMMYIAVPEISDEDLSKLNDNLQKTIESLGGKVVKVENWGKRELAYKIKHKKEGHYVLFEIEGSGKEIAELERRMRVNDLIMRYITVRVDTDRKAAEKMRALREKRKDKTGKKPAETVAAIKQGLQSEGE
ncbi:MAG: 30S ribosomal protein S6 [Pyrinomonadaceae bacterium]|nr:30S ribosomal protein S6 [Pyrinomonadaceae bacterium]MCX7640940.1 30S ribosomal protein S6 [Pyrinomonadaceae bacterium]MDW8304722.1 30S ribosomal protein S6 [Acidobacteriota bacterium]